MDEEEPKSHPTGRPRRSGTSPAHAGLQITDRDRLLLAFAAEHRLVLATHVAVLLETSVKAADRRLHALREAGLLEAERRLYAQPSAHRIKRDGLRVIGSRLPAPRPADLSCYRHDVGLAWLWLAARADAFGPVREVVSERRMRSHDGGADGRANPLGVRLGGVGPGGRDRLHYPDLVLMTESGHRVALELELSTKPVGRREGILAGYAADPHIDAVLYLVDRPSVGRATSRSAARLGISERVHVQRVEFGRPVPTAQAERVRERSRWVARAPSALPSLRSGPSSGTGRGR